MDIERSLSLSEFCLAERISKSKYYALRKKKLSPDEINIDGVLRITPQSHRRWREKMIALGKSKAVQLEVKRRRELAEIAGRAAAKSPLHISKRRRRR